jgi:hypothetical protein
MKTKNKVNPKLFLILAAATMLFYAPSVLADINLIVKAKGTKSNGVYAHFKVLVNGFECGSKYSAASCKEYAFSVPFEMDEVKTVEIVFDNDHYTMGENRNLFVNCIYVGNELPVKSSDESVRYVTKNGEDAHFSGLMEWNGSLIFDLTKINVHQGNITLSSQEEVDRFATQYVGGDLTISGEDIVDLSALYMLTSVKGSLIIKDNPRLVNITGLNSVLEVGFVSIAKNPRLTTVDALHALCKCGGMYIGENKSLTTIKCFNSPDIL